MGGVGSHREVEDGGNAVGVYARHEEGLAGVFQATEVEFLRLTQQVKSLIVLFDVDVTRVNIGQS